MQNESRKAEVIAALKSEGKVPRIDILVHGLPDEESAFRIEAAVIDALELAELTNQVRGWGTAHHGRAPLSELIAAYGAMPVEITDPSILIRINRLYRPAMNANALYEATRGSWRVGERRERSETRYGRLRRRRSCSVLDRGVAPGRLHTIRHARRDEVTP